MSFPGFVFQLLDHALGVGLDSHFRIVARLERAGAHDVRDPLRRLAGIPHALHGIERLAPDEERIELLHHPGEVDLGIHDDPVVLAVGPGDVAVEAHRAAESNQSHKRPPERNVYHTWHVQSPEASHLMLRLEAVVRDIRYACRSLARRPGFAVVAVMTLAVGMGTMTVAFSAVNAFFLAGPPIDAPGAGLIAVTGGAPEIEGASLREFEAFARDVPALDVSAQTIVTLSRRRGDGAAIAWGLAVTDNYFDTLGVQATVGRTFNDVNELSAVVSHRFWREDLDEASLTGLTLPLNGLDVPIIGVLPSDFRAGFYDADVWVRIRDWDALRLPARIRRPDVFQLTVMAPASPAGDEGPGRQPAAIGRERARPGMAGDQRAPHRIVRPVRGRRGF